MEPVALGVGVLWFSHIHAEWHRVTGLASAPGAAQHTQAELNAQRSSIFPSQLLLPLPGSAKTDARSSVISIQTQKWSVNQEHV